MTAKISSISLTCYGTHPSANITVVDNDPYVSMSFSLTNDEAIELQNFAASIANRRKSEFVNQIQNLDATPLLAAKTSDLISKAPVIEDAEFTETPRVADPDDDDIPF